jgi:hypothetical protein
VGGDPRTVDHEEVGHVPAGAGKRRTLGRNREPLGASAEDRQRGPAGGVLVHVASLLAGRRLSGRARAIVPEEVTGLWWIAQPAAGRCPPARRGASGWWMSWSGSATRWANDVGRDQAGDDQPDDAHGEGQRERWGGDRRQHDQQGGH